MLLHTPHLHQLVPHTVHGQGAPLLAHSLVARKVRGSLLLLEMVLKLGVSLVITLQKQNKNTNSDMGDGRIDNLLVYYLYKAK